MKDWIPLIQSLVWPVFITGIIIIFRSLFEGILKAIKKRVEEGSSITVSSTGLILGSAPQLPDNPTPNEIIYDGEDEKIPPELFEKERALEKELIENPIEKLQLIHTSKYLKIKNGRNYYRLVISLDPHNPEALSKVEKVVYFLHKTFKNSVREINDKETNFELRTAAWGEFTIRAEIYFKGKKEPLKLSRYLDIQS